MSYQEELREYEHKAVQDAQIEAQIGLLSNQVMELYHVGNPPELQEKIHEALKTIVLKQDFPSARKDLQDIQKESKQFMLHPSPAKQEQNEIVVGPFFKRLLATHSKNYKGDEPSRAQSPTVDPEAAQGFILR